jgi:hypothetical protein
VQLTWTSRLRTPGVSEVREETRKVVGCDYRSCLHCLHCAWRRRSNTKCRVKTSASIRCGIKQRPWVRAGSSTDTSCRHVCPSSALCHVGLDDRHSSVHRPADQQQRLAKLIPTVARRTGSDLRSRRDASATYPDFSISKARSWCLRKKSSPPAVVPIRCPTQAAAGPVRAGPLDSWRDWRDPLWRCGPGPDSPAQGVRPCPTVLSPRVSLLALAERRRLDCPGFWRPESPQEQHRPTEERVAGPRCQRSLHR